MEEVNSEQMATSVIKDVECSQFNQTDIGNAERLVARYGDRLRYVPQWGWMVWDGKRWSRDVSKDASSVMWFAIRTVRAIGAEASTVEKDEDRIKLLSHAKASEAAYRIQQMVKLAQSLPEVQATPEMFDTDPYLFNVANGTIDLRTGNLLYHCKEDYITLLAPVEYDPDARSQFVDAWLSQIFMGDVEMIEYIQRVLGYGITGKTTEHKIFMPHGSGRNGKSTLFKVYREALGEYAAAPNQSFIVKQDKFSKHSMFDASGYAGKRALIISETDEGTMLDEGRAKMLSGGDPLKAEFKYGTQFEYIPAFKIFIHTNNKPVVTEQTVAMWSRIRLIPFLAFFGDNPDKDMEQRLIEHLPAFLAWVVEGAVKWVHDGLKEPESVKLASDEYKLDSDVLADFLTTCIVLDKAATIGAKALYRGYKQFMEENEDEPISEKAFASQLEQRGYKKKRTNSGVVYLGLRLKAYEEQQASIHAEVNRIVAGRQASADEYEEEEV